MITKKQDQLFVRPEGERTSGEREEWSCGGGEGRTKTWWMMQEKVIDLIIIKEKACLSALVGLRSRIQAGMETCFRDESEGSNWEGGKNILKNEKTHKRTTYKRKRTC